MYLSCPLCGIEQNVSVVSAGDTTIVCDCGCKYTVNLEEYYYTQLTRSI
jgi:hypothetical protein